MTPVTTLTGAETLNCNYASIDTKFLRLLLLDGIIIQLELGPNGLGNVSTDSEAKRVKLLIPFRVLQHVEVLDPSSRCWTGGQRNVPGLGYDAITRALLRLELPT